MKIDGLEIIEGSSIKNAALPNGPVFPGNADIGEMFYVTTGDVGLHIHNGTTWVKVAAGDDSAIWAALDNKVNIVSPELNGIVSTTGLTMPEFTSGPINGTVIPTSATLVTTAMTTAASQLPAFSAF